MALVCDLDGVIWLGSEPVPGSAEAIARLRSAGEQVVFVTNNAAGRIADQEAKLEAMGIPAVGDVIGSAMAAGSLVEPGERVLVIGEAGLVEQVQLRGAEIVEAPDERDGVEDAVDAVVVGLDRRFDYGRLRSASTAIRNGARFIASNTDVTFPTPAGLVPGAGSLVAAVTAASGVEPVVAGKPHRPIADLVRSRLGDQGLVVGDRDDTDGAFARALGYEFALVLTGVTGADEVPADPAPAHVAPDLGTLADRLLAQ